MVPYPQNVRVTSSPHVPAGSYIAPFSRHLFTAKAIFVPIAGFTFFIWTVVKAKGVGPIIHQPATLKGSELGWAMVVSLMSCISNMATLVVNAPDFASRATTPSAAALPQLVTMPLGFIVVSFMGIIVSSSSTVIYGESIWNPIDLLGKFLDPDADGNGPSSATRFGVWFISAAFILAQVCIFLWGTLFLTVIRLSSSVRTFLRTVFRLVAT
jgi:nucleobase:cation symporter-1, NCS1 family